MAAVSLRGSVERVADPANLDESVGEVFAMMLGGVAKREGGPVSTVPESVTAVVGFGGVLSGACILRGNTAAACRLAGRLTGQEFAKVDDTVQDGFGELCNMLAGSWKSKVPELAAHCGLSVPAVISGRDYNLHVQAPAFELRHIYRFEDAHFEVRILCDSMQ